MEFAHRHGVGTPKADSTTRTLMKTPAKSRPRYERGIRFQTFLLGLKEAVKDKIGNNIVHFSNGRFGARVMSRTAPISHIAQRTYAEPTWAKIFAKILRRLDRA